ncbi:hypothetical protein LSTR_LSTR000494 [Laodelphax striatellus]|uniref:Ras suppressor protein 1 n=1 Tax=Laodelphax striatellus TaxID=195883 RepID=A0A482X2M2_LAOST|nr:hypothetical protein LSTR_LSTR000494 [Laodelphax striatellus]
MNDAPVSCLPTNAKMSKAKKVIDEAKEIKNPELDLADKNISSFEEMPGLFNMLNITRLSLSHNKLSANLVNLEILNLFNNQIEELPASLSSMPKLRIFNVGMNRLNSLPRGFGAFPVLEVLDLTYNNLNENSLPGNFFMLETLRALYLGDNDFEILPAEIGNLDLVGNKSVFRMDFNPWVTPISDQLQVGVSHVMDYIRTETYRYLYSRQMAARGPPPPKLNDKSRKISRLRQQS